LIAKLVVWGENRHKATARMQYALDNYEIAGTKNNIPFLKKAFSSGIFKSGNYDTHFISKLKEGENE
jgi:3-methylcrotonyl-CoA carboxylase alpha subunit